MKMNSGVNSDTDCASRPTACLLLYSLWLPFNNYLKLSKLATQYEKIDLELYH